VDNTAPRNYHSFADTWSGGGWHLSTRRGDPSGFYGISCPAAGRCFASGYNYPSVPGHAHQLMETWNGRAWTAQQAAQPAGLGAVLMHVSCVSTRICEAVGYDYQPSKANSDVAVSEVWNGSRWLGQVTPNP
jgi:hypothetical protein